MQFQGEHLIQAPRARVWQLLNDPAALAGAAGFTQLTPDGEDRYAATLAIARGPMNGTVQGHVELLDKQPSEALSIKVTARGMGGGLNALGHIRLQDEAGATRVFWSGSPKLTGLLAFGSSLLTQEAAQTQADRFFALLEREAQKPQTT